MADTVGHINLSKCCCCRQYIDKIKHAVNLFGDKSLKEGIKEGLELYGSIRTKEDVNIDVLSYVCQQCYTYHLFTETEGNSVFCGPETVDVLIIQSFNYVLGMSKGHIFT